jgi:non-ribosomal peptide synthetase component E (peptide arylation enzyme)
MALPAHRRHELSHLARHAEAAAIAVPDRLRDFDHQVLAHDLAAEVPGPWHVLVAGADVGSGSVDLRALCGPGDDPDGERRRFDVAAPGSRDVAVFLLPGGTTGLPKLIARTHDDYAYNATASAEVAGFDGGTVYLVSLPAGHNFPLACPGILGALLADELARRVKPVLGATLRWKTGVSPGSSCPSTWCWWRNWCRPRSGRSTRRRCAPTSPSGSARG